jgi:hypothetical protein
MDGRSDQAADHAAAVLARIDDFFGDQRPHEVAGVATQLARQLADPRPADARTTSQLEHYKGLDARWADWASIRAICKDVAATMARPS